MSRPHNQQNTRPPAPREPQSSPALAIGQIRPGGHADGLGPEHDETGVLADALDGAGLARWFEVYGEHLTRFHRRLGRWESFDELLVFNIHAERVLWSAGLFPWEGPEGLRAEVAPDPDVGVLLGNAFKPSGMLTGG